MHYADDDNSRYIKHDYEISFFADKKHTQEVQVALMEGKPAAHTWRLYGNYHDFYNVRETVVAELFSDIRKTSKAIDERLKKSYLLPKSEPILFFMNSSLVGVFRLEELDGLQTLNVKETDKMTAIVRSSYNSNQSYFKAEITDVTEQYFLDAWGSTYVESAQAWLANYLQCELESVGKKRTYMWSPGQHKFDLSNQKVVFDILQPEEEGCTLNESYMMSPVKTGSGIWGVLDMDVEDLLLPCDYCELAEKCPSAKTGCAET